LGLISGQFTGIMATGENMDREELFQKISIENDKNGAA
jgi:hypothetical protein